MALVNYVLAGMLGTVVAMAIYQHQMRLSGDAGTRVPSPPHVAFSRH